MSITVVKKERKMKNHFVIGFDGFLQRENRLSFEVAKERWKQYIGNKNLYQYDCSVHEVNEAGDIVRRVEYAELRA